MWDPTWVTIYSQSTTNKMQRVSNLFISVRHSTCFRRVFLPSSIAQNCTYNFRHLSDRYCYLLLAWLAAGSSNGLTFYVQFWASDDGRENRLKHVQRRTELNKLWNVVYCWLYSENILAMHGLMNVKWFTIIITMQNYMKLCKLSRVSVVSQMVVLKYKSPSSI